MRALTLEEKPFSLLWQAYFGTNKSLNMQELGIAARLLTKFKEISIEDKTAPAGRKLYLTDAEPQARTLFLEEDEWNLMKQLFETTPWHTMAAIEVVAFKKFFDELPEYKQTAAALMQ